MIWRRWTKEYLPQSNYRSKWNKEAPNVIQVGDLVWLVGEYSKRCDYRMARVTNTHPGSDGIIRTETIKTSDGIYKRPIVKLAPFLNPESF